MMGNSVQIAVRIGIVAFGLLVLFAALEAAYQPAGSPEVVKAQLAVSHHLAQQAVTALGNKPDWTGISIEKSDLNDFELVVHYATQPSADMAATDAKAAVAAMLYQLTLAGHHPTDEKTTITAQAIDGSGNTVGSAHYDADKDKVVAGAYPIDAHFP
jgi:hypothetical protein